MSNPLDGREKLVTQKEINRRTMIAFVIFICFLLAAFFVWNMLYHQPKTASNTQPLLRKNLEQNERIFGGAYSNNKKAKPYDKKDAAAKVRVNGAVGLEGNIDAEHWRLKVARKPGDTLVLTIDELRSLPKTDVVFDFKCIEGWSQVTWWSGVKVSDFIKRYDLGDAAELKYAGLITPDEKYYVGIDMKSMMHPQTILCYEMNGKPLPMNQGYPLRLIIPVKYGVKHLKRIGVFYFSNAKPKDYWAEQGYDYYGGL